MKIRQQQRKHRNSSQYLFKSNVSPNWPNFLACFVVMNCFIDCGNFLHILPFFISSWKITQFLCNCNFYSLLQNDLIFEEVNQTERSFFYITTYGNRWLYGNSVIFWRQHIIILLHYYYSCPCEGRLLSTR